MCLCVHVFVLSSYAAKAKGTLTPIAAGSPGNFLGDIPTTMSCMCMCSYYWCACTCVLASCTLSSHVQGSSIVKLCLLVVKSSMHIFYVLLPATPCRGPARGVGGCLGSQLAIFSTSLTSVFRSEMAALSDKVLGAIAGVEQRLGKLEEQKPTLTPTQGPSPYCIHTHRQLTPLSPPHPTSHFSRQSTPFPPPLPLSKNSMPPPLTTPSPPLSTTHPRLRPILPCNPPPLPPLTTH